MLLLDFSSAFLGEVDYAWVNKRNAMIFCRVEKDFKPLGPLGIYFGSRLYINFAGKYPFEDVEEKLLKPVHRLWQNRQRIPQG